MPSEKKHFTVIQWVILITITITLIFTALGMQTALVQACDDSSVNQLALTVTRTKRPEKPYDIQSIPRACGELVFVVEKDSGVGRTGLKICGTGALYLFEKHPRDIVPFYQFRDLTIRKENKFLSTNMGPINTYIIGFKNYVGISSCSECGLYGVEPTWTTAPLTPYTPTPIPPTSTPYIPSSTPTATASLAPNQITETSSMFEILFGTPTLVSTPVEMQTPTLAPPAETRTPEPVPNVRTNVVLVLGLAAAIALVIFAYLIWISNARSS